jgi:2-keto-4-pentenoate hydratase
MRKLSDWVRAALFGGVIGLILVACSSVVDPVPDGSKRISDAWTRNEPVPLLSDHFGKELTTEAAYRIQYNALHLVPLSRAPEGFKAGLTTPASQQMFGSNEPLAAVLPAGSQLKKQEDGYHVKTRDFRQAIVEVEIGYRFAERIQYPLPDVQALKAVVSEMMPVIELPDLSHADADKKFTAIDIIASNAGAKYFIAGLGRAPSVIDPNSISITLYREGQILTQGSGSDALNDQWQALLFLVNRTLASGWTIEPGQILITGALGKAVPLQKGIYVADYGRLGRIEWVSE